MLPLTGLLLLAFFIGPSLGSAFLSYAVYARWLSRTGRFLGACQALLDWTKGASPFGRIYEIMMTGFSEFPIGFQVLSNVGIGVGCFLLAWLWFDRFTREQKEVAPRRGALTRRKGWRSFFAPSRSWMWPLAWKDFFFSAGGRGGILVRFLLLSLPAVTAAIVASSGPRGWDASDTRGMGRLVMIYTLVMVYLELVLHASRILWSEVRWGTLPALVLLPMSPGRLVFHKFAGRLVPMFPYVIFFVAGAIMDPSAFAHSAWGIIKSPPGWYALSQALFFLQLVLYLSVVFKFGGLAIAIVTWLIGHQMLGCGFSVIVMATAMAIGGTGAEWMFVVPMGMTIGLTIPLFFLTQRRIKTIASR